MVKPKMEIDYDMIVIKIIQEYLFFRIFHPQGSIQDFIQTSYMKECEKAIDENITL